MIRCEQHGIETHGEAGVSSIMVRLEIIWTLCTCSAKFGRQAEHCLIELRPIVHGKDGSVQLGQLQTGTASGPQSVS